MFNSLAKLNKFNIHSEFTHFSFFKYPAVLQFRLATRTLRVDCRVKLIDVSLEVWVVLPVCRRAGRTATRRVEAVRQSTRHENAPLFCSGKAVGPLVFGG